MITQFKINDDLNLKLEDGKTNIYVKNELFNHCKYLLLNLPFNTIQNIKKINSIDDIAEKLDKSLEPGYNQAIYIPPETEFWGHCSNIQVWYENNYDSRFIHSNLAFPLLKKLTEAGDHAAKKIFKDEIAIRFESGNLSIVQYLLNNKYLDSLNEGTLAKPAPFWFPKVPIESYKMNFRKIEPTPVSPKRTPHKTISPKRSPKRPTKVIPTFEQTNMKTLKDDLRKLKKDHPEITLTGNKRELYDQWVKYQ